MCFFYPLFGCTRFQGRRLAAIRLSHPLEPSGQAVREEVRGLDNGGQHGEGLFFCATLIGRRGDHTPFVQGAATSNTGAEADKPDPSSSWEGHSRRACTRVWNENAESCGVVDLLHIPLEIRPMRHTHAVVVRKTVELLCGRHKWTSQFEASCVYTRWTNFYLYDLMTRQFC